jgi:conjugative transfer signal peptidase TraF
VARELGATVIVKGVLLIALLVAVPLNLTYIRWNFSPSVPMGFYWRSNDVHRGDVVEVCAPDAIVAEGLAHGYLWGMGGPCYHHSFPLVKYLAGVGGDVVDVSADEIAINGQPWPHSARRYIDGSGNPIVQWIRYGRFRLASDRVLILGTHPDSWDGRVFADIQSSSIRARWSPLLTMKGY